MKNLYDYSERMRMRQEAMSEISFRYSGIKKELVQYNILLLRSMSKPNLP